MMIDGIIKTKQKIITADNGSVYHGIKTNDNGYNGFGEVYFSSVKIDSIKAWKLHKKMTCNLLVLSGAVMFGFYDLRKSSSSYREKYKLQLSIKDYSRLTIPNGVWFGFKGLSKNLNLICNIANMPHDPDEVSRKAVSEIDFDWEVK